MNDKTIDDFFIDWCYHALQFSYAEDRFWVCVGIRKFFETRDEDLSILEFILIKDLLDKCGAVRFEELTDHGEKLREYFAHEDGTQIFSIHEKERAQLKYLDYPYCSPNLCCCGSKEKKGCQNPFFRLSSKRQVV